jgi:hypothetical protein
MTDHRKADAALWGIDQTRAWERWDFAVVSAQAFGWQLSRLTGRLIGANCAWGAESVARIDREMYHPTTVLSGVDRVTRALAAAAGWDRAVVRSGISGVISELEHQGKRNRQVADAVAGWHDRVESQRDRLAGAALELKTAYLVAVGGGARPAPHPEPQLELGR